MTRTHTGRWQQAPALVVSLVALFAALSGAAMALPGTETVNSGDIKNESIKSVDLKDDKAVASTDVIDETLTGADVEDSSLTGGDVTDGSLTSQDVADQTLSSSDLGPGSVGSQELGDGIKPRFGSVNVNGGTAENGAYNFGTTTASCLPGEELIGGGGFWQNENENTDEVTIAEVVPNHAGESVTVRGGNDSGDAATLLAYAECL